MSAAHTMNRYKFTCAGGAADVATRLDNAGQAGPLHIAPEHMLADMLPDALDKELAPPNVVVFISDINGLILGGMLFGDDMLELGVHWAWAYEPLAAIFQALDQTNMDKTPIKGKYDIAYPIAVEIFATAIGYAMSNLPLIGVLSMLVWSRAWKKAASGS